MSQSHWTIRLSYATLAFCLEAAVAWGQSPALDPAFGEGGRVWVGPAHTGGGPLASHLALTADGGILLLTDRRLDHFSAGGARHADFGYGEAGAAGGDLAPGWKAESYGRPIVRPDGSIFVPVLAKGFWNAGRLGVIKLRSDGRRDAGFGANGFAVVGNEVNVAMQDVAVTGAAVEPDGRIVVAGWGWRDSRAPAGRSHISLARFLPDGRVDESFAPDGRRVLEQDAVHARFAAGADGSFALPFLSSPEAQVGVVRFLPGGEPDAAFGPAQQLRTFPWSEEASTRVVVDHDGGVVVATGQFHSCSVGGCFYGEALARLDRAGRPIADFGDAGTIVRNGSEGKPPWYFAADAVDLDPAGGLVILTQDGHVIRLDRGGVPDHRYSNGGVAAVREPHGLVAQAFVVAPDGTVLLAAGVPEQAARDFAGSWRMALYRVRPVWDGSDSDSDTTVVEYVHTRDGHYFVTPLLHEQLALDWRGGWQRTGREFRAWSVPGADLRGVCRFFSGSTYAPKSTHFYTHSDAECAALKERPEWTFEGVTFAVRPPEGAAGARACPWATVPLYRAYNDGQGGAPNHRYTTDAALLDQMVAQGWVAEGEAGSRIFACVPWR